MEFHLKTKLKVYKKQGKEINQDKCVWNAYSSV